MTPNRLTAERMHGKRIRHRAAAGADGEPTGAGPACPERGGVSDRGLELVGIAVRYGDLVALDDCSLTVRPGRVLGLLGPNGAGKTTAMRCIFGLVRPRPGRRTLERLPG